MSDVKFGADLLVEGGRIGGHIIITENEFIWEPFKFGFVGNVQPTEVPINDLEGYIKDGTTLYIGAEGYPEYMAFYTWKGQSIIDAIKNKNPSFRMYATNEFSKSSGSGCLVVIALIVLSSISISFLI